MTRRISVLFLCTGNSCRSQMAEGFCREMKGDLIQPSSAGIVAHGLNPYAVKVMSEAGIDISKHRSKTIDDLGDVSFDYVVTVCDNAAEACPFFPAKTRVLHRGFDDPPGLASGLDSEEEILEVYRRVRDEIKGFVERLPGALEE